MADTGRCGRTNPRTSCYLVDEEGHPNLSTRIAVEEVRERIKKQRDKRGREEKGKGNTRTQTRADAQAVAVEGQREISVCDD